jgi:hypothetical protein
MILFLGSAVYFMDRFIYFCATLFIPTDSCHLSLEHTLQVQSTLSSSLYEEKDCVIALEEYGFEHTY